MAPASVSSNNLLHRNETFDAHRRGVEQAIRLMQERLGKVLSIDALADAAFMSRYNFTPVVTYMTGVSPGRFLVAVRMQEAKRLLLQTDRRVTGISLDVGYNSVGTFTRIFADFVGFSPMRFRQLARPIICFPLHDVVKWVPNLFSPAADISRRRDHPCRAVPSRDDRYVLLRNSTFRSD